MKIAALADIHGNFPALQAVGEHVENWGADLVFVVGDTINRGPSSKDCLQFVRKKRNTVDWRVIRGNHEDYILEFENPERATSGPYFEMTRCTHWNYLQLTARELTSLKALPYQIEETTRNGKTIRAVHGSMLGTRKGIYPHTPQEELPAMVAPAPQILIVGHTHRPILRATGKTQIVNAGSVGLPFDGDPRPSYAQIYCRRGHWERKIVRLNYNQEAAIKNFYKSGFLAEGKGMSRIILTELKLARSLISPWLKRYKKAVLEEKISVEEGVEAFLADLEE